MNRRQLSFLLVGAVVLGGLQGCTCSKGCRSSYVGSPWKGDTCDRCAPTPGPQPPRFTQNGPPFVPAPTPPPGAVTAPPASGIQQNAFFLPGPPASPMPPGTASGGLLGAPEPVETEPARPMPSAPNPPRDTVHLSPPQSPEPPPALSVPGAKEQRDASPAMPVDIPHFAVVKTDVANGQQPFPEGVAWLKAHRYRTVLHVRAPGEEDRAARDVFEQHGMAYRSLEVSPTTLSKTTVEEFNRLVTDSKNLPLFVYDKEGSLAGALWYLHFRIVDKMSDEKARGEANQLGFKEGSDNPQLKNMWIAVQNYLAKNKP